MDKVHEKIVDVPPLDYYDQNDSDNICFLCNDPNYKVLYEVNHYGFTFKFQKCRCGLIKQTPMPNQKFFYWFYNSDIFFRSKKKNRKEIWGYYDYFPDESSRISTSKYRYHKLSTYIDLSIPREIMKIGPATGTFLYIANKHGHHAIGCDVSSEFIKYARSRYNVQIDHCRFEEKPCKEQEFDIILLFNVIENIPNQVQFLHAIQRTVKIGGYFILNFVDMKNNLIAKLQKNKYFIFRPPICYAFEMSVMKKILEKFGFRINTTCLDIRYMHLEKILTLLGWNYPLKMLKSLKVHQISFPIYAYPSKIVIAKRVC